ncbi:RNA-binding protein [Schizosaccharomyces japonicus yFS275]|uniref:RNA-binding protein n=1 Tax=Schizosaccharomyces japonicus (strain yFS275 / FY16936) TaxID=402676 RepID=B6K2B3_SCHJY|nr:RNA-binding protein [Schizosaccharomyces japonicus yFS275]EEB07294.1 RNA-binding protein [Schizosaccharomyces japonicus yFS275]
MALPEFVGDLVVLHFETNLDDHGLSIGRAPCEVREICWVILDGKTLEKQHCGSCAIRDESIKTGVYTSVESFREAVYTLDDVLQRLLSFENRNFTFVVMNARELRVLLPKQAKDHGIVLPSYLRYPRLFDLSNEYAKWQVRSGVVPPYTITLSHIFGKLDVDSLPPLADSASVLGISADDLAYVTKGLTQCWRLANAVTLLLMRASRDSQSLSPAGTPTKSGTSSSLAVLTRPIDCRADLRVFLAERSAVVHIAGLANDTTQAELENWFVNHGLRSVALWTLKTPDQYKSTGTGYVVFSSHKDATDALNLNGSCFGDRMLEITPSSPRTLERASDILTSFPSSKNRPRPGDWNCPMCGFSNFQRRTSCFRCSFPGSSNLSQQNLSGSLGHDQFLVGSYGNSPHSNGGVANAGYHVGSFHSASHTSLQPSSMPNGVSGSGVHSSNSRNSFGGNVPFRAGDWKCGSGGCGYHNFAKNVCCLRCGASRATASVVADSSGVAINPATPHGSFSNFSSSPFSGGSSQNNFLLSSNVYPYSQMSLNQLMKSGGGHSASSFGVQTSRFEEYSSRMKESPARAYNTSDQGDWLCECGFTNFRRRTNCLRCNAPHATSHPNMPASLPSNFGSFFGNGQHPFSAREDSNPNFMGGLSKHLAGISLKEEPAFQVSPSVFPSQKRASVAELSANGRLL